jgi:hypothetical protein
VKEMAALFDVVLVRFPKTVKVYLVKAPAYTHINTGDIVEVEDSDDGIALKSITIYDNCEDDLDTLMKATGAKEPLSRVKAYYCKHEIEWEDEEND